MALNAFMTISGEKTGNIKGNAREGGNTDKITVIGYHHDLGDADPADKKSYKHRPLVIIKAVDPASPLLHSAQAINDVLTCNLFCTRVPSGGGVSENHFTITLSNARIASIRTVMENNRHAAYSQAPIMEEVAFAYESINWSYKAPDGANAERAIDVNPAPDKLDDWAKSILTNAFKKHTDALLSELKVQTKAMYQELMGEKKPPAK